MLEKDRSSLFIPEENESGGKKPKMPPPARRISFPLKPEEALHDLDFALTGFSRGPNSWERGYKIIVFSYLATFIDVLVGIILSVLFILLSSLVLRTEFSAWLQWVGGSILHAGVLIFICFISFYQFLLRLFLGHTIGDWVCGLRLGTREERLLSNYAYRVGIRVLIHWLSGFVLLPVLSLLLGRDLAGQMSGLHLVKEDVEAGMENGR